MYRISLGSFPLRNLVNPYQQTLVQSGKEQKVYEFTLPDGIVCFIYNLSVSKGDFLEWKWIIDGEEVNLDFSEGSFYFDPPFLVKKYTEFYVKNNSGTDLIVSVYCDGICHKEAVIGEVKEKIIIKDRSEELLKAINEIKSCLEKSKAKGEIYDMKVNVTDKVKMLYDSRSKGLNWTACDITNAGPDPVYIAVNKWRRPQIPLAPGLTTNIDFGKRGAIKKVYLVCDEGKKATVYIRILK